MLDWFTNLDDIEKLTTLALGANVVLVVITGYYAIQNRQMVREMERARSTSVMPLISLGLRGFDGRWANIAIENVGNGPAVDLRCVVELLADDGHVIESHQVDAVALRQRERAYVFKTRPGTTDPVPFDEWMKDTTAIRVHGTATNSLGSTITIDRAINPHETWTAMSRFAVDDDHEADMRAEMKKIREALATIAKNQA